jgi:D-alanine-D-alanine ligase
VKASLGYPVFTLDFDHRFVDLISARKPDVVFNALHGGAGEDGTVQAILDWLGVPYQGSGVRASAVAMDKWVAKSVMRAAGLPTPDAIEMSVSGSSLPVLPSRPTLPFVVKPRAEGSAVGVTIVRDAAGWAQAVTLSRSVTDRILVEAYVSGREFTVAILGDDALPVIEIEPSDEFYSYHSKYTAGKSRHIVPAQLPAQSAEQMRESALSFHRALGARDYSRVDILMDDGDGIHVLECNTLPGLTRLSLFPDAAASAGIPYEALIERLISMALSRSGVRAS